MLFENYRLRRVVVVICVLLVLILAGFYIYRYLSMGTITVTTDNLANYVKVEWSLGGNKSDSSFSKQAKHSLTVRVKAGTYQISAYDQHGLSGVSRTITLKPRQKLSYTLNPASLANPEPVYGGNTNSVFTDGSQLLFLGLRDPGSDTEGDGNIMHVDASDNITTMFPDNYFSKVDWINADTAMGYDRFHNLYVISGGNISQLQLPFTTDQNSKFSAGITGDGEIFVSDGYYVYAGSLAGDFKKVFTADKDDPVSKIVAGKDKVAVVMNSVEALESKRNGSESQGKIAILNSAGKTTEKSISVLFADWSPDGKHLIAQGPLEADIYDSSLNVTGVINVKNASNFKWLNNGSVMFSVNNEIWSYDTGSTQSKKLGQLATGGNIGGFYPTADGSYVYFTGTGNGGDQLFRLGLKSQKTDSSLNTLSQILPEDIGICSVNYVNFIGQPTITITYPDLETTSQLCLDATKRELRYYNLNLSALNYSVTAITQQSD